MGTKLPLVSICCTTYNHEKYIRDAIEGFLMQKTTFPVEILIHDDASTDKTAQIVKEYAENHSDLIITIFQTENQYSQGIKPWPNFVFPRARGKYIALCEGDDYWTDPLKLQKQVEFLEGNEEYSMCFHNAKEMRENTEPRLFSNIKNRDYTGDEILGDWIVPTASVVFRGSVLSNDFINSKKFIYGDIILFLNLAKYGKIRGLEFCGSIYRRHQGGITNNMGPNKRQKSMQHHIEIAKRFPQHKLVAHEIVSRLYFSKAIEEFKELNICFTKSLITSIKYNKTLFIRTIIKGAKNKMLCVKF
jgi:glycosyltransferase involved in cell wall biosynthesis